ncbi:hypothetical protein TWF481_004865 [Arthrobotrys musiformis]|uniref:Uncharacterized protein n=1 Tax=Arthrobotrys musiformis TaxID=47236 RepID=A0AAV9WMY1_9PEZI
MSGIQDEPYEIDGERFLTQLRLVLKLLTFEWEANLEILATKLETLCQGYLNYLDKVRSSGDVAGFTTKVVLAKRDWAFESAGWAPQIPRASDITIDSIKDALGLSRTQVFDETLSQESCHFIVSHPKFGNEVNSEQYRAWIDEYFINVVDLPLKSKKKSKLALSDGKADGAKADVAGYGDFTFTQSTDSGSEAESSRLYVRLDNLTKSPLTVEDVQYLMRNTLYPSVDTVSKFPGFVDAEFIPVPNTEFQDAWDREALAEWYRGAALLWGGEPFAEVAAADKGGSGSGAGVGMPPVAGLAGNLMGALPISNVVKSAAAITDVSAITDVATNITKSENETKKESTIEAKVETKDEDGTKAKVEAKVEITVSEIPDTAEGASTPATSDVGEPGPSVTTVTAAVETVIEAVVEAGTEELKATIVESTTAIQKSETEVIETTVALAEAQASVALGKAEAALTESTAAATEILESKAALVTSTLEFAKSKDSLVQSAISLGKSKSSAFGTILKVVDKTGEAFGVDLIDDKLYMDGPQDSGKLTGWAKVRSEFPCPFDYPPDKDYKLKFTKSIDDCLPSLMAAEESLSKIIDTHSPASAISFDVKSIPGRFILNKFLIATHRIVITYICSENVVRYATGVEVDPAGGSMLSSGLNLMETGLGFMSANPAIALAAKALKAGRDMAGQGKMDAAAEFRRKSTALLRKLWLLTTEVHAFLWFTKPEIGGRYEFDTAFHKASWKLVRENRALVYAEEEKPKLTTDVSEDYFIYLQEQALMLKEYTDELRVQSKEMMEVLGKVL